MTSIGLHIDRNRATLDEMELTVWRFGDGPPVPRVPKFTPLAVQSGFCRNHGSASPGESGTVARRAAVPKSISRADPSE